MSLKNRDEHTRWRNKTVAFRVSPEENTRIEHYTRKQQADDKFDMISGTNGLLGAADGAFLLTKEKRTGNAACLDVSGRDQPDQRLHLLCTSPLEERKQQLLMPQAVKSAFALLLARVTEPRLRPESERK